MNAATYYGIDARWGVGPESSIKLGARFLDLLDKLGPISPAMSHWQLIDFADLVERPLAQVRAEMTEFVSKNIILDDDDQPDPGNGYSLLARGAEIENEHTTPQSIEVWINGGSRWRNDASIDVGGSGHPQDPALVTYPIYRGALEALVSSWPCPWAEAHAFTPDPTPSKPATFPSTPEPKRPRHEFIFRWMLYLSAPLAAGLEAPADLIQEPTPGGGVILSAVRDRFDPTNPEHLRRSLLLWRIMEERVGKAEHPYGADGPGFPARVGPY